MNCGGRNSLTSGVESEPSTKSGIPKGVQHLVRLHAQLKFGRANAAVQYALHTASSNIFKKMSSEPHILSTRHRSCGGGSRCLPLGYLTPSGGAPSSIRGCRLTVTGLWTVSVSYNLPRCAAGNFDGIGRCSVGGLVTVCRHECQTMLRYAFGHPS